MARPRTVYKVIWRRNAADLISASSTTYPVRYIRGKYVEAKKIYAEQGRHLFVFARLSDAACFAAIMSDVRYETYKAHALGVTNISASPHLSAPMGGWPRGSLMAKNVKLLERVA